MAMFKEKHIDLVLEGRKTQTRRIHKSEWKLGKTYSVRACRFEKGIAKILIIRKFRERLGDISLQDIRKEGFSNIWEFKAVWEEIYGQEAWNPELVVTVYEFVLQHSEDPGSW